MINFKQDLRNASSLDIHERQKDIVVMTVRQEGIYHSSFLFREEEFPYSSTASKVINSPSTPILGLDPSLN